MYNQQADNQQAGGFKGGCGPMGGRGFRGGWGGPWGRHRGGFGPWGGRGFGPFGFRPVPVNIEETDSQFVLNLYAAGLAKDAINVGVKDDVLTISYTGTEPAESDSQKYTRREFQNASFERQFALNGKVLTDQISAAYTDGILTVTLPKNPETNKPAQAIAVG